MRVILGARRPPKPKPPAYHRDWLDYAHSIILGLTFLAAFAAASFTARQAYLASKQLKAARDGVKISEDTERRQLRAYVFAIKATMRDFDLDKKPNVRITVRNTGQTPAYRMNIESAIVPTEIPIKGSLMPPTRHLANFTLGPASEFYPILTANDVLSPGLRARIQRGIAAYFVYGTINYFDAFDDKRYTQFKLIFDAESLRTDGTLALTEDDNAAN